MLTPRQRAGRMNQRKSMGITPEGREKLRQAARTNRPWEHSTGPRTAEGKSRSRMNAYVDGRTTLRRKLRALRAERLEMAAYLAGLSEADILRQF